MTSQVSELSGTGIASVELTLAQGDQVLWYGSCPVVVTNSTISNIPSSVLSNGQSYVALVEGTYTVKIDDSDQQLCPPLSECDGVAIHKLSTPPIEISNLDLPATLVCLQPTNGGLKRTGWAMGCGTCDGDSLTVKLFDAAGNSLPSGEYFIVNSCC